MNDIKEPVQKRAIEKRLQLIEAAKRVFNTIGFHNTHIKDITREADISVGLFYKYFKDKNDIYLIVLNILFEKEMSIASDFKYQICHEKDKKKVIRGYLENRLEMTTYNNIIEEFHVLSEKYEPINNIKISYKGAYLNIVKDILSELWTNPTEASLEVGTKLIRCIVSSNVPEINNLKKENLRDEYFDRLTDILYNIMILNK